MYFIENNISEALTVIAELLALLKVVNSKVYLELLATKIEIQADGYFD